MVVASFLPYLYIVIDCGWVEGCRNPTAIEGLSRMLLLYIKFPFFPFFTPSSGPHLLPHIHSMALFQTITALPPCSPPRPSPGTLSGRGCHLMIRSVKFFLPDSHRTTTTTSHGKQIRLFRWFQKLLKWKSDGKENQFDAYCLHNAIGAYRRRQIVRGMRVNILTKSAVGHSFVTWLTHTHSVP